MYQSYNPCIETTWAKSSHANKAELHYKKVNIFMLIMMVPKNRQSLETNIDITYTIGNALIFDMLGSEGNLYQDVLSLILKFLQKSCDSTDGKGLS